MAQFPRINGDSKPVLNNDGGNYVNPYPVANAVVSGTPVQPAGPFLGFYTVTGAGALSGTQVSYIIKATEQLATVHLYQYSNTGGAATNNTLAMAIYPINSWSTTDLAANITAALTAGNVANTVTVTATATFTGATYPA